MRLSRLVQEICDIPGDFRIRLSSIEATEVTAELIAVMAGHPRKVCPHLHVCLQSGSDSVLRRMRRRWSVQHIVDRCERVKQQLDRPALTTDVIVGFPAETDREFQETLETCRRIGFSKIHMFPFSPRRGTPAAEMVDQVSPGVKQERARLLAELETECRRNFAHALLGYRVRMMVEDIGEEFTLTGTTGRYLPAKLTLDSEPAAFLSGQVVEFEVAEVCNDVLCGSPPICEAQRLPVAGVRN